MQYICASDTSTNEPIYGCCSVPKLTLMPFLGADIAPTLLLHTSVAEERMAHST